MPKINPTNLHKDRLKCNPVHPQNILEMTTLGFRMKKLHQNRLKKIQRIIVNFIFELSFTIWYNIYMFKMLWNAHFKMSQGFDALPYQLHPVGVVLSNQRQTSSSFGGMCGECKQFRGYLTVVITSSNLTSSINQPGCNDEAALVAIILCRLLC